MPSERALTADLVRRGMRFPSRAHLAGSYGEGIQRARGDRHFRQRVATSRGERHFGEVDLHVEVGRERESGQAEGEADS